MTDVSSFNLRSTPGSGLGTCRCVVGCAFARLHLFLRAPITMAGDDLWALFAPRLLSWPENAPGPRPVPDRPCLQSILYVLRNNLT
ncbi:hypothetical protein [Streptomyces cadmiisoli]|uniref:hypothetical protein n=1 Tax=Streptomyces cadmiisoli TaxID=2184053 RepID=UPI003D71B941